VKLGRRLQLALRVRSVAIAPKVKTSVRHQHAWHLSARLRVSDARNNAATWCLENGFEGAQRLPQMKIIGRDAQRRLHVLLPDCCC